MDKRLFSIALIILSLSSLSFGKETESLDGEDWIPASGGAANADAQGTNLQHQAPRTKRYEVEWFKVMGQMRHPLGEVVCVSLCCENDPNCYGCEPVGNKTTVDVNITEGNPTVDLMFLIDQSNSMQKTIDEVAKNIDDVVAQTTAKYPYAYFRYSAITYQDFQDPGKNESFGVYGFDQNIAGSLLTNRDANLVKFRDYIKGLKVPSFEDQSGQTFVGEDINGGLRNAVSQDWISQVRILIHFTDDTGNDPDTFGSAQEDIMIQNADGSTRMSNWKGSKQEAAFVPYTDLFQQMQTKQIEYHLMEVKFNGEIGQYRTRDLVKYFTTTWATASAALTTAKPTEFKTSDFAAGQTVLITLMTPILTKNIVVANTNSPVNTDKPYLTHGKLDYQCEVNDAEDKCYGKVKSANEPSCPNLPPGLTVPDEKAFDITRTDPYTGVRRRILDNSTADPAPAPTGKCTMGSNPTDACQCNAGLCSKKSRVVDDTLVCPPSVRNDDPLGALTGRKWGQGVWVRVQIKSKEFGHLFWHQQLIEYDKIKCLHDHTVQQWFKFSKKTNIQASGHCATRETVSTIVTTDLEGCCEECEYTDYKVQIKVQEDWEDSKIKCVHNADTGVCSEKKEEPPKMKLITFNKFQSDLAQYIREKDIVHISMGNTQDFHPLQTNLVVCPADMSPVNIPGRTEKGVKLEIENLECRTDNVVHEVTCDNWQVVCREDDFFFFRLVANGEVYSLGRNNNGTIEPIPNGLLSCNDIDAAKNGSDIVIVNDHMRNFTTLSQFFKFDVVSWPPKTVTAGQRSYQQLSEIDLECTSPMAITPPSQTARCDLKLVTAKVQGGTPNSDLNLVQNNPKLSQGLAPHSAPKAADLAALNLPQSYPKEGDERTVCRILPPEPTHQIEQNTRRALFDTVSGKFLSETSQRVLSESVSSIMVFPMKDLKCDGNEQCKQPARNYKKFAAYGAGAGAATMVVKLLLKLSFSKLFKKGRRPTGKAKKVSSKTKKVVKQQPQPESQQVESKSDDVSVKDSVQNNEVNQELAEEKVSVNDVQIDNLEKSVPSNQNDSESLDYDDEDEDSENSEDSGQDDE